MLDPDGDPSTSWDVPDVCSNSWGVTTSHGYPPCDPLFWSYLDACKAAGILIVFAAGNEGSSGLRRPPDRATDDYRTFAVAAVDGNNVIIFTIPYDGMFNSSSGQDAERHDGHSARLILGTS